MQEWHFQPGDQVLVSYQAMAKPRGEPWQGPFTVVQVLRPLSYEVQCHRGWRGRKHLHFNDLQWWILRPEEGGDREVDRCLLQDPAELCEGNLP